MRKNDTNIMNEMLLPTLRDITINKLSYPLRFKRSNIYYWPAPKNACTSVKNALYRYNKGSIFSPIITPWKKFGVHDYYPSRANRFNKLNRKNRNFCVYRDPLARFISFYCNRILFRKDLEKEASILSRYNLPINPDINFLTCNLIKYQSLVYSVMHHTLPQTNFLGSSMSMYWKTYDIRNLKSLEEDISTALNVEFEISHEQTGGKEYQEDVKSQLNNKSLEIIRSYYFKDFEFIMKQSK